MSCKPKELVLTTRKPSKVKIREITSCEARDPERLVPKYKSVISDDGLNAYVAPTSSRGCDCGCCDCNC